jgi:NAD(P)H-flavin reductase
MILHSNMPKQARVMERVQESSDIFTLRLQFPDAEGQREFQFAPGQFNMLYLHGVGEVPISIVSDPQDDHYFDHTIRALGRVTRGLEQLREGDHVGVRGPFGVGWPLAEAEGKDVVIVTGGLGCAPVVAVINYLFRRRDQFGHVTILQGVKHHDDLIWRERYAQWAQQPDTTVALAADNPGHDDSLFEGNVVQLFDRVDLNADNAIAMLCGPEIMMHFSVEALLARGFDATDLWVSMERNMQCANGLCGHCQVGPLFVCRDGPVFRYDQIAEWFFRKGF